MKLNEVEIKTNVMTIDKSYMLVYTFFIYFIAKINKYQAIVTSLQEEGLSITVRWNIGIFPTLAQCLLRNSLHNPYNAVS